MQIKIFKGNFLEIGRQQGKIYQKNGISFEDVKIKAKIFHRQLEVYKKYYPELLEEFKGIAQGGSFDEEKLIYKFISEEILWWIRMFKLKEACTIFGIKNKNGVFVGRNYDWVPVTGKLFKVYKVLNPQRNNFLAVSDMAAGMKKGKAKALFYIAEDIINDKGLYAGITFASNSKWSYGLSSIYIIKLIAETCSTVKESLKVFETIPLCCPKNFFIADRNGNMAAVEHASKKRFRVIYPKDKVLIHTNHYLDPELTKEDKVLLLSPTTNSFLRYYEALQNINARKNKFRFSDIIKILGNTDSYIYQNRNKTKTIWSLALDMEKRRYKLYWDILSKRKEKVLKF